MWASIIGICVVQPYLLPDYLNGPTYCVFLKEMVLVLSKHVPFAV